MVAWRQRYWKRLFCFPNFGRFRDVFRYPYCRLIILCRNISKTWVSKVTQINLYFDNKYNIVQWYRMQNDAMSIYVSLFFCLSVSLFVILQVSSSMKRSQFYLSFSGLGDSIQNPIQILRAVLKKFSGIFFLMPRFLGPWTIWYLHRTRK